uniref:Tubulin/FtsZ 2-layer sandwich domain-containing protein n=1 Tax=Brassica oleracea var. oleracea TaxID=109376 RepID=A0A0D3BYF3_BRAOL
MVMSSIVTESESIVYWLIVHTRTEKNGQAQEGIAALRDNVDTLIVIPNDMLLTAVSLFRLLFQKHSIWQMICFVKGYRGISDNITILGLVNVDFADVRAIMANAGSSLMGVGTATDAYCYRLPLKWNQSDNVCVLVITIIIIIIFGTVVDPSFSGQVSITLIATGFKRQEEGERKPLQGTQVDASMGVTRRSSSSFTEGSSIEIPDFLKKKGRSCYPRL